LFAGRPMPHLRIERPVAAASSSTQAMHVHRPV
jgi:hypothetical protein